MKQDLILKLNGHAWQRMDGQGLSEIEPWPTLKRATLIVSDFDNAELGLYRLNGKSEYAPALIEKRARDEGLIDSEAHVFVHHVIPLSDGFQALFTIIPLNTWSEEKSWAEKQADHCLLVPLGALLSDGLRDGHGRVLRVRDTIYFAGVSDKQLLFHRISAIGNDREDIVNAVSALARGVLDDKAYNEQLNIEWCSLVSEGGEDEGELLQSWSSITALATTMRPMASVGEGAKQSFSALPSLTQKLSVTALANSPVQKVAWLSERLVAGVAAAMIVVSLALFSLGFYAQGQLDGVQTRLAHVQGELENYQMRIRQVNQQELGARYHDTRDFVEQMKTARQFDPIAMLSLVKQSSGENVQIRRVRLERDQRRVTGFRIDGVSREDDLVSLGNFLAQLKANGWQARAVSAADSQRGAFAYILTPDSTLL